MNRGRYDSDFGMAVNGRSERELLEDAKHKLRQQNETLERIKAAPTTRGYVVSKMGDILGASKVLLSVSQQLVEVILPNDAFATGIRVGSCVRVQVDSLAILDLLETPELTGDVAFVRVDGSDGSCEVDWHGNVRVVRYDGKKFPEAGDRVMVDSTCNVIIRNLGKDDTKFSFEGDTGISWDDVGGLHQAKEDMLEAFELPYRHPELYKAYGKKQVRGVMLYGPAGCGKTLLAKACATSVRGTHGKSASGFIYVKGPELLDKFVGQTEAQIRALFSRAREHFKKHGYPAVLFIDEADAILGKRGARLNMGTETTVVPQFLSEMDGLHESGTIVLLATNRPDTLDPAVTRDGRIDRKVKVSRPDRNAAEEIFRLNLKGKPIDGSVNDVARQAADFMFDPRYELYEVHMADGSKKSFTLGNLVNGAMIAGMVDNASTNALRRDIARNSRTGEKISTGITTDDFRLSAEKLFIQNLHTNHETELEEFCEPFEHDVAKILRPKKVGEAIS